MPKQSGKPAKLYPTPRFKTIEEEREFWETHSPLEEGYELTPSKPSTRQRRDSLLAIRLNAKEIDLVYQLAKRKGMNISSFVRSLILQAEQGEPVHGTISAEDIADALRRAGITVVEKNAPEKKRRVAAAR